MINFDQKTIEELAKKHNLKLLLFFGSQVSGKTHKFSDFDFGYLGKKADSYRKSAELLLSLAKIIHQKEDKVDVANLEQLPPLLKYEVLKNNQILYQENNAYSEFFVNALKDYFQSGRLFNLQATVINKKIEKIKSNL